MIGYVEEYAYAATLTYVRELSDEALTASQCAAAIGQLEAVRAGVGLGVLHTFIAERHSELKPMLPERRATRAY